jgi:hypothetical protein
MPRGRPKLIGPLLPKGGTKTLNTKKRIKAKNLAYSVMSPVMLSGDNVDIALQRYGMPRVSVVPEKQKKAKRQATPAQLAALAKGRAARAEKIRTATNQIVKAATQIVASVNETVVPKKRGRKPLSAEQKALNKQMRAEKKKSAKLKKD